MDQLTNQVEHYADVVDAKGTRLEDGTFKNNGHTAVPYYSGVSSIISNI